MKLFVWAAAIAVSAVMANASFAAVLDSHGKNKTGHVSGTMVNHPKPGSAVMFNPQPDPPGDKNGSNANTVNHATPGSNVMFNPQPDPPGDTPAATSGGGPG